MRERAFESKSGGWALNTEIKSGGGRHVFSSFPSWIWRRQISDDGWTLLKVKHESKMGCWPFSIFGERNGRPTIPKMETNRYLYANFPLILNYILCMLTCSSSFNITI